MGGHLNQRAGVTLKCIDMQFGAITRQAVVFGGLVALLIYPKFVQAGQVGSGGDSTEARTMARAARTFNSFSTMDDLITTLGVRFTGNDRDYLRKNLSEIDLKEYLPRALARGDHLSLDYHGMLIRVKPELDGSININGKKIQLANGHSLEIVVTEIAGILRAGSSNLHAKVNLYDPFALALIFKSTKANALGPLTPFALMAIRAAIIAYGAAWVATTVVCEKQLFDDMERHPGYAGRYPYLGTVMCVAAGGFWPLMAPLLYYVGKSKEDADKKAIKQAPELQLVSLEPCPPPSNGSIKLVGKNTKGDRQDITMNYQNGMMVNVKSSTTLAASPEESSRSMIMFGNNFKILLIYGNGKPVEIPNDQVKNLGQQFKDYDQICKTPNLYKTLQKSMNRNQKLLEAIQNEKVPQANAPARK